MHPKAAKGIENSVDPDQAAHSGSRSVLFVKTCLSKYLGLLQYCGSF